MFSRSLVRASLRPRLMGRCFKSTINPIASSKKSNGKSKSSYKLYLLAFASGGILGLNLPLYSIFDEYVSPLPESDADISQYKMDLENELQSLPIVKKLALDDKYLKIRAWENIDDSSVFNQTMTSSTLRRPGGIAIEPIIFINENEGETISIIHVGKQLTGYPLLVHGGMLATILDETLKRCSILSFQKNKSKHPGLKYDDETTYAHIRGTSLSLSYKFPTLANSFIVVKAKASDVSPSGGVEVKLKIQNLKGRDLVVGEGVFENTKSKKWIFW